MARTTTNYGWNISEGSDLVNPLTDIFPNFESLDTDLKGVSDSAIGTATELKTGTVHALTRDDTSRDVFKFTATSNFTAGDTFTVDAEQVSALTTSGEQLTTGCYIIGSEVLVAKKGTLLTFYISNVITDASTLEGHSASYFAAASDLADTDADVLNLSNKVGSAILTTQAQDCSGAINELNKNLNNVSSDVYSTGVSLISADISSAQDLTPSQPFTNFNTIKVRIGSYYSAQNRNLYMQAFDIDLRHLVGSGDEFIYSWYQSASNFMSVEFGVVNGKLQISAIQLGTDTAQNFAVYVEAYGYKQTL